MDYDYHADIAARRAKVLAKMEEQNRIRKLKEQEEAMRRAKEQEENDRLFHDGMITACHLQYKFNNTLFIT